MPCIDPAVEDAAGPAADGIRWMLWECWLAIQYVNFEALKNWVLASGATKRMAKRWRKRYLRSLHPGNVSSRSLAAGVAREVERQSHGLVRWKHLVCEEQQEETELLCTTLLHAEAAGTALARLPEQVQWWWARHKAVDAERKQLEEERAFQIGVARAAWSKLTPDEQCAVREHIKDLL